MTQELLVITLVIILGGLIKGLSGFGYAVISTPLLALIMPVQEAVAFMIIPLMAANVELVAEADREELKHCLTEFKGLFISLVAGVTVSMFLLSWLPVRPVELAVSSLMLLFVASRTRFFDQYFSRLSDICFKSWEPAIGFISGIIYGASNIAVTVVAYLKSQELTQRRFVATLAAIILGLSIYRTGLAYSTGLFTGPNSLILSIIMCVPAVASVEVGNRLVGVLPDKVVENLSLAIILIIALRLLAFQ